MAGTPQCTCPHDRAWTDRTGTTPGCPEHDPDGRPALGLVDVLKVLALTQLAADEGAAKSIRSEARRTAAQALGLGSGRFLP